MSTEEPRTWAMVMRDLLQMARATHKPDQCSCEDIFDEADELLRRVDSARKALGL